MNTPETDLTATPRTDNNILGEFSHPKLVYVNADFARTLECELNAANEKLRRVKEYPITHKRDCLISASTFSGVTFCTKCDCGLQDLLKNLK